MRCFLCFWLLLYGTGFCQADSSTYQPEQKAEHKLPPIINKLWIPSGLAILTTITMLDSNKYRLQNWIRKPLPAGFHSHVEDFIQYAPALMMYSADLLHVKSKNNAWNQTKYLAISEAITTGIVLALKYSLKIQRPDESSFNSFPSGHTAQAFCEAHVFFNEYKSTHPLFASTGYLFAASTGALRVLNNRHWVPDVLAGAGIGILVSGLVYHFEPLKNWDPFAKRRAHKKSELFLTPVFSGNFNGFQLRLKL